MFYLQTTLGHLASISKIQLKREEYKKNYKSCCYMETCTSATLAPSYHLLQVSHIRLTDLPLVSVEASGAMSPTSRLVVVVCWGLNVPATCWCISGTDLFRQLYVLPHCLTQSQCTDTRPTSPSSGHITPGAWLGSHWITNFEVTGKTQPGSIPPPPPHPSQNKKKPDRSMPKMEIKPRSATLKADALTTRPMR